MALGEEEREVIRRAYYVERKSQRQIVSLDLIAGQIGLSYLGRIDA
jgi:hypothetical protein